MGQITQSDVADAAGVSVYTVSQAVNGRGGLSEETRVRVLKVAEELGYIPNRSAQDLKRTDRSQIAVITADASNVYYVDMMRGINRVARDHKRIALTMDIAADGVYKPEQEDAIVREAIHMRLAGIISALVLRKENMELLRRWNVPVVFVDSQPLERDSSIGYFGTDNISAGHRVGEYLKERGLENWLLLMYPALWSTRSPREKGLREAADALGTTLRVLDSPNHPEAAASVLMGYLNEEEVPDVVIAGNNPILQGVLDALKQFDLKIPDEVALFAYDDFAWAKHVVPSLTLLDEDPEQIGTEAAQSLMRVIDAQDRAEEEGKSIRPQFGVDDWRTVPAKIIGRHSCGENLS